MQNNQVEHEILKKKHIISNLKNSGKKFSVSICVWDTKNLLLLFILLFKLTCFI